MGKSKVIDWEEYKAGRPIGTGVSSSANSHNPELWDGYYNERGTWIDTPDLKGKGSLGKGSKAVFYKRCCETHKPLLIDGFTIYGGSCSSPVVKDADIYVGFERGMETFDKGYPWVDGDAFQFLITDGSVPPNVEDFKKLLVYLSDNLKAGKKVHIGCIGGHGRTGLVLSALVKYMTGNKNATDFVRTNYCDKSVETFVQIEWLHKHFGIDKVKPSKSNITAKGGSNLDLYGTYGSAKGIPKTYGEMAASSKVSAADGFTLYQAVKPVRVKGSVWGF